SPRSSSSGCSRPTCRRCGAGPRWPGCGAANTSDLGEVLGSDVDAERNQADRDELEVAQAERDADDRQAEQDAGDQVADGQPPAEQDDPDHVTDERAQPGGALPVDGAAERPQ